MQISRPRVLVPLALLAIGLGAGAPGVAQSDGDPPSARSAALARVSESLDRGDPLQTLLAIAEARRKGVTDPELSRALDAVRDDAARVAIARARHLRAESNPAAAVSLLAEVASVLDSPDVTTELRLARADAAELRAAELRAAGDEASALQQLALASILRDNPAPRAGARPAGSDKPDPEPGRQEERVSPDDLRRIELEIEDLDDVRRELRRLEDLRRAINRINDRLDKIDVELFDRANPEPLARRLERMIDDQQREIDDLRRDLERLRRDVDRLRR